MAIDIETLNQVINSYVLDVKAVFPIEKAYLYGSYAKGTPKWDSDIDLCFFSDYFEVKEPYEIIYNLINIARKYSDYDIEPRAFPSSEITRGNPFVEEILKTGHEVKL